jgi:adenylylsulfate kinase-like enzyme
VSVSRSILSNPPGAQPEAAVEPQVRTVRKGPRTYWFFGRSGAGKTTLAARLVDRLRTGSPPVFHLDGDTFRDGLSRDLGFSARDRAENHRRLAEVARLLTGQGFEVVVSSMAPLRIHRDVVRSVLGNEVTWVHVDASLETCVRRDAKRLYQRASAGRLPELLDFPFEGPESDETVCSVDTNSGLSKSTITRLWNRLRTTLPD